MSEHVILRLVRPYESADEYLEAEAVWIGPRGMLLIDTEPLPLDTIVRFAVSITVGEPLIRAEARVVGYQDPTPAAVGGLKVRFRRFGASTKAFIDRAQTVRARQQGDLAPGSAPESSIPAPSVVTPSIAAPMDATRHPPRSLGETLRRRAARPVDAPANREELLERLRKRAKSKSSSKAAAESA